MPERRRVRIYWESVLEHAAAIVRSYSTGVTLRQLFYRLVSEELLPNDSGAYSQLSRATTHARRDGTFPSLIDRGREIRRPHSYDSASAGIDYLARTFRRDRRDGQEYNIYIGVEKAGLIELLESWFSDFGLSIVALGGYSSQTFVDDVRRDIRIDRRPAVLLYAGDHDPSGHDIGRDFVERVGVFADVLRVALNPDQVRRYQLPPMMGKPSDTRAADFTRRFGSLIQVELDALPPDVLEQLYRDGLDGWWADDAYQAVLEEEKVDVSTLTKLSKRGKR